MNLYNHVLTKDKTSTFYSPKYEENYHSTGGALREAFTKFIAPCNIENLASEGSLSVLDVGFGLGYNAMAALYTARNINKECLVEIVSLEEEVLGQECFKMIEVPLKYRDSFEIISQVSERKIYEKEGVKIEILSGDARQEIKKISRTFGAVFLDPFSPRKNPELWTVEFFRELYKRMDEFAILATYSSATPVRSGLVEAGFTIGPGPGDHMKRGGTLATRGGKIPPLTAKEIARLSTSPEKIPYYDTNLHWTYREIMRHRDELKKSSC